MSNAKRNTAAKTLASMTMETSREAGNDNRIKLHDLRMSNRQESNRDAVVVVLAILTLITLLPFLLI
jgi:hypothetical protein